MRNASSFPVCLVLAVFGAALLANGLALVHAPMALAGAGLLLGALALAPRAKARMPDRAAVRLALRLARFGERTLLVERGSRMCVVRAADFSAARLQYVGALQKGALILARER